MQVNKNLEDIFYKYLVASPSSKNYPKRLTKIITFFISKGRFLEARFYLDQLEKTHSENIISIRLGYKLAIALFDNQRVIKYDNLLYLNRKNELELEWYRLQYYYSVNNIPQIIGCLKFLLLNKMLDSIYMETILQIVWNIRNYEIASMVQEYAVRNRLIFDVQMDKMIRDIVLEKLRDSLVEYKNV